MRVAGIVLYNPNYDRLCLNICRIRPQVDILIFYCNSYVDKSKVPEGEYVWLGDSLNKNTGIAYALNKIMEVSKEYGAEWCLLLDQDSIVPCDMISTYENIIKHIKTNDIAVLSPQVIDKATNIERKRTEEIQEIKECITSASYNNVKIWYDVGKFREDFFIDYVDWEYCARARKNGYKILQVNSLSLDHQLGHITYHKFGGQTFSTYNHSAFRKYYITRNSFLIRRLYPYEKDFRYPFLKTMKRMFITIAFENQKRKKCYAIFKGIWDYIKLINKNACSLGNEKINIYIVSHKKFDVPSKDSYIPIQVGEGEDLGYLRDNSGDNISAKNRNYCELTALYWIWKNSNSNIVGLTHYRRYFYRNVLSNKENNIVTNLQIEKILRKYDIILPLKLYTYRFTLGEQYSYFNIGKDLLLCRSIIENKCPEYINSFDSMYNGHAGYYYNMLITRKEILARYCEWLFPILYEVENNIDITGYTDYQKRVYGFLAERLFNVWILHNYQYRIKELPVFNNEESYFVIWNRTVCNFARKLLQKLV